MASWKAFRPRESQASTSGRVSASPRSACGSTLPCAVHFSRPRSLGKAPVTRPRLPPEAPSATEKGALRSGFAAERLLIDRGGEGNNLEEHFFEQPWIVTAI